MKETILRQIYAAVIIFSFLMTSGLSVLADEEAIGDTGTDAAVYDQLEDNLSEISDMPYEVEQQYDGNSFVNEMSEGAVIGNSDDLYESGFVGETETAVSDNTDYTVEEDNTFYPEENDSQFPVSGISETDPDVPPMEEFLYDENVFSSGYVIVKKDTVAYSDPEKLIEDGYFLEDSIVYAEKETISGEPDTEWLHILFDTAENRSEDRDCLSLYVPVTSVEYMIDELSAQLMDGLLADEETRNYQDILLPEAAYMVLMQDDQEEQAELKEQLNPAEQEGLNESVKAQPVVVTNSKMNAVASAISISQHPSSVTVNAERDVTFTVRATGSGLTYQWQFRSGVGAAWSDSGLEGSDTGSLTVKAIPQRAGLYYRCVIRDTWGNVAYSNAARLNINLTILEQPIDREGINGVSYAYFTVKAAGNQLRYQWQYLAWDSSVWKDSYIDGSRSKEFHVPIIESRDNMSFRCVITDEFGNKIITNPALIKVSYYIYEQPSGISTTVGKTVYFTVKASGIGLKYQWQWRPNSNSDWVNTGLTGNKTATLTVTPSLAFNGRQYRCIIQDKRWYWELISDTVNLTVRSSSNSGLRIIKQPSDVKGYIDETASFSVSASGSSGYRYQWQYLIFGQSAWKNSNLTGSHSNTLKVPITASRNRMSFRCVITDSAGKSVVSSSAKIYTKINIYQEPYGYYRMEEFTGDNTTIAVDASGTGLYYQWQYLAQGSSQWKNSECQGSHSWRIFFLNSDHQRHNSSFRCVIRDVNGNMVISKPVVHPTSYGTFGYANYVVL